jgi:hypothetical protein
MLMMLLMAAAVEAAQHKWSVQGWSMYAVAVWNT